MPSRAEPIDTISSLLPENIASETVTRAAATYQQKHLR